MSDELTELRAENDRLRGEAERLQIHLSQADLRAILEALGVGPHARPYSAHEVAHRDILPSIERLRQECRDRECTERDIRARLADAEAKLAQVKSALLMGGQTAGIRAQAAIAIVWDGTS